MENYTITIIANGDGEEAASLAQDCAANLKANGHSVISASVAVERGGTTALVTDEDSKAALAKIAESVTAKG